MVLQIGVTVARKLDTLPPVKKYETEVNDALTTDLGKSHYEGFMCESGLCCSRLYPLRKIRKG